MKEVFGSEIIYSCICTNLTWKRKHKKLLVQLCSAYTLQKKHVSPLVVLKFLFSFCQFQQQCPTIDQLEQSE